MTDTEALRRLVDRREPEMAVLISRDPAAAAHILLALASLLEFAFTESAEEAPDPSISRTETIDGFVAASQRLGYVDGRELTPREI